MDKKLLYKRLADAVAIFHWILIAYLISGLFFQIAFPWYAKIHLIIVATVGISQLLWLGCPLVTLENALRAKYDPSAKYYGSFTYNAFKKIGITLPPIVISLQMIILLIITAVIVLVTS